MLTHVQDIGIHLGANVGHTKDLQRNPFALQYRYDRRYSWIIGGMHWILSAAATNNIKCKLHTHANLPFQIDGEVSDGKATIAEDVRNPYI